MALKSWIFLLQSAKDLSWRSLTPGGRIPPGAYRLSLQSPKPNRAIDLRLRCAPPEGDPIIRRYTLESDSAGHAPILAPLEFEVGQWEIDCRPDVFAALSGEDWRESLRFEIGEAEQISVISDQVSDIRYQIPEDREQTEDLPSDKPERRSAFLADLPAVEALTDSELQFPLRRSTVPEDLPESLTLEALPVMELSDISPVNAPKVEAAFAPEPEPQEETDSPLCRLVNYVLQLDDLEKQRRFTVDITLWEDLSRGALPLNLPCPQAQNSLSYRTVPRPNHILPPKLRPRPNGAEEPQLKLPQL